MTMARKALQIHQNHQRHEYENQQNVNFLLNIDENNVIRFFMKNLNFMKFFYEDTLRLPANHCGIYCSNKLCFPDCEKNYHLEQHYDTMIEELERIVAQNDQTRSNYQLSRQFGDSQSTHL